MTDKELIILDVAQSLACSLKTGVRKTRPVSIAWLRTAQLWVARRKSKTLPEIAACLKKALEDA